MRVLASVALLLSLAVAANVGEFSTPDYHTATHTKVFKSWATHFGKTYDSLLEEANRFIIFVENWEYIHKVNNQQLSYSLGLNQFADLTADEFRYHVHGKEGSCLRMGEKSLNKLKSSSSSGSQSKSGEKLTAPSSIDWTTKGVVTPVKNQGQCGSCWAFSTTGSIESAAAIKTGKLVSLSEQQLVDCSRSYGNMGCNGGLMDQAFKYVEASGGLCSEQEYPYTARDGTCQSPSCGTKYDPISGYTDVSHDSEQALMDAVAKGPVSIAIEADQSAFQFYRGGVLTGSCGTRLDHGVLVVGYGTDGSQQYWKVKNSWGASWGEQGYIRLCRDCNKNAGAGECGILEEPSYPTAQ
jgi:C1A family cysteine protease